MAEKTNIYDLVEEVNKTKKKSSMEKEKEMNDIYSMLDAIKDDNSISVDEVREKLNNYTYSKKVNNDDYVNTNVVKKPIVGKNIPAYDKFSECIYAYIQAADYGTSNAKEYVEGHRGALEKYFVEVRNNRKDIYVVEAHLNEEINSFESKDTLYDKGYYDGLVYFIRSIKKAKDILSLNISNKLKEKI